MPERLDGKVAIVTGAGGGIGRAHALLLAEHGAAVVVNDIGLRAGASAETVVEEIRSGGGRATADTTSATWDGAPDIVEHAVEEFGRLDILINNATAAGTDDLWRMSEYDFDLAIDVNLKGYFALIRQAVPVFAEQASGAIVNTSSGSGFGHPSMVGYASAKEGVIGLTRTVAREVGRFGIRCNAIRPLALGQSTSDFTTQTSKWGELMLHTMVPDSADDMLLGSITPDSHPPSKIAPFVVWLCTDAAREVNGRTFQIEGDTISLFSEPEPERTIVKEGGWTLDELDATAPETLVDHLENRYRLDEYPHLHVFDR